MELTLPDVNSPCASLFAANVAFKRKEKSCQSQVEDLRMLSARGVCQEEVFAQSCSQGTFLALEMRKASLPWELGQCCWVAALGTMWDVQGPVQVSALPVSRCDAVVWAQVRAAS